MRQRAVPSAVAFRDCVVERSFTLPTERLITAYRHLQMINVANLQYVSCRKI